MDAVCTPILAWAGTHDTITSPAQATFLEQAIGRDVPVDVCIVPGAGHFSFINDVPPQVTDPLSDRETFLARLADRLCRFVAA